MKKKSINKKHFLILLISPMIISFIINSLIFLGPSYYPYHYSEVIVHDTNDEYLFTRHFNNFSSYVKYEQIPDHLIKALIASEDKRFFKHHGLDYGRIIKSAMTNLINQDISQGGSTITQQYARTLYLSNEKSLTRKIKEALIAKKIEMTFTKEEILEGYLNCIYFGQNIYGINGASDYFYHKNVGELTLSEAAMLIGMIKAPSYYSPEINMEIAKKQQQKVLQQMKNQQMINESQYLSALNEKLLFYYSFSNDYSKNTLYYYDAMKNQLNESHILTNTQQANGYQIFSCLDKNIQNTVEKTVQKYHFSSEISIVVMKPYSGDVLALLGGKDYITSPFNRAIHAKRQSGSAIKPLLYYLALENGMTPLTKMKSEPTTFYIQGVGEYSPKNANEEYAYRDITMLEAIALSDNVYATKTNLLLGSSRLKNLLELFDVENVEANPTIGLGTNTITPLQLTAIYNTFASEGQYYKPRFFRSVKINNKEYFHKPSLKFSLSKENVILLNYMLCSPFDEAFKSYATPSLLKYKPQYRFSAKTGTTDTDRWVIGFNPHYTICVWMGNDKNEPFKDGSLAKTIFQDLANSLMEHHKDVFYTTMNLTPFTYQSTNGKKSFTYYIP